MNQGKVSDRLSGNLRTNNAHGRGQDLKPKRNVSNDRCINWMPSIA